jgi:predicted metalloprotease
MNTTPNTTARQARLRIRSAIVGLLAAAALLANVAGAQAMGPTQTGVVATVNAEYWDLTTYWGGTTPGVQYFNYYSGGRLIEQRDACWGSTAGQHGTEGFYCPKDHVIYLDFTQQNGNTTTYGDGAVGFWLAHEYGHHVESIYNLPRSAPNNELLADCFAGVYFQYARYWGRLYWADYLEAQNQINHLSWSDTAHGTPPQRLYAFQYGFNTGNWRSCANLYR